MKVLMENWNNHIAEENINEAFQLMHDGKSIRSVIEF